MWIMNLPSTTVASNPMAFSSIARTSTSGASVRLRILYSRIVPRTASLVVVSNIFDKLDVPTRAAATAFAYQHKMI